MVRTCKVIKKENGAKSQALSGLKVLDFGWFIVSPLAASYLGMHGATVIKVESMKKIDLLRTILPMAKGIAGVNRSIQFTSWNSSKYSITLNLAHPKGFNIAKRLVSWADVLIENLRPQKIGKLGLSYDDVKKINPSIIMASGSLQGQTGPRAEVAGLGLMMQGLPGMVHPTGPPEGPPTPVPAALPDFTATFYLLVAILAALDYRRRTSKGQYIDLSEVETALPFLSPNILDYCANDAEMLRVGNRSSYGAPHNAYRCLGDDRWCVITVFTHEEWTAFCNAIGNPEWTKQPRFATLPARKEHEDELDKLVEEWTLRYSTEAVMKMMQSFGIAAGVVENGKDLHQDQQLKYRHHFWPLEHDEIGQFAFDGPSYRLSETPAQLDIPSPCLGQHTEFICREILGMSSEEFVELDQEGVFT